MSNFQKPWSIRVAISGLLIIAILSGCSSTSNTTSLDDLEEWDLVWISDSNGMDVLDIYAEMIEEDTGKTINVHDSYVAWLPAGKVLSALKTGESTDFKLSKLVEWIPEAEVIVFWALPSEFYELSNPFDWKCSPPGPFFVDNCDPSDFSNYTETLTEIYQLIFDLRDGQPTIVRTIDAFSTQINQWKDAGVYEDCRQCWSYLDDAMRQAADDFNIPLAPLVAALNGPNWVKDPSDEGYLKDGVHVNDIGAELIAQTIRDLGYDPVVP